MRILVTGHKGYIGAVLAPMLTAAGHEVVGLDSDLYAACDFGEPAAEVPELAGDLRDVEASDLKGFDAVAHLAGISNDPVGNLDPKLTYEINYRASVELARRAKAAGVERFVFSSSCSSYGAAGDEMLTEGAPLDPVTPYGHSKVLVEQELAPLADERFSPTFLRNATVYGVSPRLRCDLVLNNLVAWAYATGEAVLKSDGTPWRPLVHVADVARAFLAAIEAPRDVVHNQAFNVGTNRENYRIRELAGIVEATVAGSRIRLASDAGPDRRCYRVDCSKIRLALPDWKPRWTAELGARELYAAYQRIGLRREEFEGARYTRLGEIERLRRAGVLDENLRRLAVALVPREEVVLAPV